MESKRRRLSKKRRGLGMMRLEPPRSKAEYRYAIPFSIWGAVQFHRTIQKNEPGTLLLYVGRTIVFLRNICCKLCRLSETNSVNDKERNYRRSDPMPRDLFDLCLNNRTWSWSTRQLFGKQSAD